MENVKDERVQKEIRAMLNELGVTSNYSGYRQTVAAVLLAMEQPEALSLISKRIYPEVAKQFDSNWRSIERNIRTVLTRVWDDNALQLSLLACAELTKRPTTAQFIRILAQAAQNRLAADELIESMKA